MEKPNGAEIPVRKTYLTRTRRIGQRTQAGVPQKNRSEKHPLKILILTICGCCREVKRASFYGEYLYFSRLNKTWLPWHEWKSCFQKNSASYNKHSDTPSFLKETT